MLKSKRRRRKIEDDGYYGDDGYQGDDECFCSDPYIPLSSIRIEMNKDDKDERSIWAWLKSFFTHLIF